MKKKKFDCVQMKHELQARILREFKGLSPEEQRRRTLERINADPLLGPFWRKAKENQSSRKAAPHKSGKDNRDN